LYDATFLHEKGGRLVFGKSRVNIPDVAFQLSATGGNRNFSDERALSIGDDQQPAGPLSPFYKEGLQDTRYPDFILISNTNARPLLPCG
jgi:hypothetical protein